MRIVGEIDHPRLKISIFKNEGKFSLKFEANLLEQTYKFRDDARLGTIDDVKRIVDAEFIEKIEEILRGMKVAQVSAMERAFPIDEEEFDVIL
jgi:DNA-binding MltR family transcriptional regulator